MVVSAQGNGVVHAPAYRLASATIDVSAVRSFVEAILAAVLISMPNALAKPVVTRFSFDSHYI